MDYLTQVTLLASGAVLIVQQILKLNIVPVSFANAYPVLTNIILSIITSIVAVLSTSITITGWQHWVVFVGTISVVAAITYNQLIGKSLKLKALEGTRK